MECLTGDPGDVTAADYLSEDGLACLGWVERCTWAALTVDASSWRNGLAAEKTGGRAAKADAVQRISTLTPQPMGCF